MTNGKDHAFAALGPADERYGWHGLTKREYFAAIAMQGIFARQDYPPRDADLISEVAVGAADALIAALNQEQR